jgi:hypothetical protein
MGLSLWNSLLSYLAMLCLAAESIRRARRVHWKEWTSFDVELVREAETKTWMAKNANPTSQDPRSKRATLSQRYRARKP